MHEKPPRTNPPVFGLFGGQLSSANDADGDLNGGFIVLVLGEDGRELITDAARPGHEAASISRWMPAFVRRVTVLDP